MAQDRPDRPADVIALSPYRAQLGRGRRLRRADALADAPDLVSAVRALPGDELYYVLHEVGLRDGGDLLAAATAEQLQTVLDFALWERDRVDADSLAEWLEAISGAPAESIGRWIAGLDTELVGLVLRRTSRIYDLSQEEPPDEPEGTMYPTPDRLFVLDVPPMGAPAGAAPDDTQDRAGVVIRIVDLLYRVDQQLARRILVGARAESDAELEESAYRWRQARMADLGFADYYEALEVYRELDPGSVQLAEANAPSINAAPSTGAPDGPSLRVPSALAERMGDTERSPFARAAQRLAASHDVENLRAALVTLTNQVLAADRVSPGDDEIVPAVLERLAATLDLALDRLAPGDDARGAHALRTIPLVKLFRLGVSLTGKLRRLALTLRREGPFGPRGWALAEADDAAVLAAVTQLRPMYPRLLDTPPTGGERPFRSLSDLARAAAAIERAAAAQAMLRGLGVTPADIAVDSPLLAEADIDEPALDVGLLARTALVGRLIARNAPFRSLTRADVQAFEANLQAPRNAPPRLPATLHARAAEILKAATPVALASAGEAVAPRWLAGLAPLEPVLLQRASPGRPTAKEARSATAKPLTKPAPKLPPRPVSKLPTKPVSKLPARPASKLPAKPISKLPSKPVSKLPSKPVSKLPSRPISKLPSRPISKLPAKARAKPEAKGRPKAAKRATAQPAARPTTKRPRAGTKPLGKRSR